MLPASSGYGKPRPRVIKIQLLRNGDVNFKGVVMRFESRKYNSFVTFLEDVTNLLTKNVFINRGGVKGLYNVNGTKVNSLLDIEDNGVYVATCMQEVFKEGPYNLKGAPPQTILGPPPGTSGDSIFSSGSIKSLAKIYSPTSESSHAKKITIVRAGNRPRKITRVLINNRNAPDFERAMTVINDATKFDSAPMHSLYTLGGDLVSSLDDIFGRHFIFFSFRKEAICLEKELQLTESEVQLVMQLNTSSNFDKLVLKKPPLKEPVMTKVLPQISIKYDLTKRIGTGCFSSTYICSVRMLKDDGVRYAMKIARKNKDTYESLYQELQFLKGVRHPHIVRLLSYTDASSEVYLMFELLGRDLKTILNMEGRIAEREAKTLMENLLSALFYLHCLKIVHRNVTTSNVLISLTASGERNMKLIDFGLACRSFKPLFDFCGDTMFMAPEMLKNEGYGEKVDVWAAGVVLYYMLSLTAPFLGHDEEEDKRLIVEEFYDISSEAWRDISGSAKHIIGRMLCKNADDRYSADNLLSHSWITGSSKDAKSCCGDSNSPSASDLESVDQETPRFKKKLESATARGDGRNLSEEEETECEDESGNESYCEEDENDNDAAQTDDHEWTDY